jgi:hypothetical protein
VLPEQMLIPPDLAIDSRAKEEAYREKYPWREYPYQQSFVNIVDLISKRGKHKVTKAVHMHDSDASASMNGPNASSHDLQSVVTAFQEETAKLTKSVNMMQQQLNDKAPPMGQKQAAPRTHKGPEIPIDATPAQFDKAAKSTDLGALLSNRQDYPQDNSSTLAYDFQNGVFIPHQGIMATFLAYSSGQTVLAKAIVNHFRGRCAQCGMRGHSAKHPGCAYHGLPATWDLCSRCRTGFHPVKECAVDLAKVIPHSYTYRPN